MIIRFRLINCARDVIEIQRLDRAFVRCIFSDYVGEDDNMQVRIIAGAIVAVVVLLVIIIIMTVLILRR